MLIVAFWLASGLGGEFMPPLDEGDLLYMPSALPGLSAGKAAELLQQTDRLIKTVPEVASVFGKAGRGQTGAHPPPPQMFENPIPVKPPGGGRAGKSPGKHLDEVHPLLEMARVS